MIEEWRDVFGYESLYEVSSLGRVKSLDRIQCDGRRRNGRILAQSERSGLYLAVNLYKLGKLKSHNVHGLVLVAFQGQPGEGMQARHLDGDSRNNRRGNLSWGTSLDNHADKKRHGTTAKGSANKQARLQEADVLAIRRSNERGNVIARKFSVAPSTISAIRTRKIWAHI